MRGIKLWNVINIFIKFIEIISRGELIFNALDNFWLFRNIIWGQTFQLFCFYITHQKNGYKTNSMGRYIEAQKLMHIEKMTFYITSLSDLTSYFTLFSIRPNFLVGSETIICKRRNTQPLRLLSNDKVITSTSYLKWMVLSSMWQIVGTVSLKEFFLH